MHTVLRAAGPADAENIRWALYTALSWNPERKLPPPDETLRHPEAIRYHRGWGRHGDLGVIATVGREVVGVDDETPEVAIGVRDGARGAGLGTRLLQQLAKAAAAEGFRRLSLSVDPENRACLLYERLGYRRVSSDGDGIRMICDLV